MDITVRPPTNGRLKYDWPALAEAAKEHPGEWVSPDRVYNHSVYATLSRGDVRSLPTSEFEFATTENRRNLDGIRVCKLHVRYTGPK